MHFRILRLACILLVFPIVHGKIRELSPISTNEHPTKDIDKTISLSNKNDSTEQNTTTTKIRINDEHIVCNINYNEFWHLSASWSGKTSHADYSSGLFLLDYAMYTDSFKDFIRQYPTVTVVTIGKAVSPATFGDVGKNKFGTFTYSTSLFTADSNVYYEELVKGYDHKYASYEVSVKIGIGFKSRGTMLYLAPYIDGYLKSHGVSKRTLDFGLGVSKVTFNPK